ncbi:MAG: hypothetical protein JXA30_20190, partial [Deltaproteobacteria bacterium]|nr:hypothetical protein [Deltaproteobacteria bacterium]
LAVPDESARGRKPVLWDESAAVVDKQQYPPEQLRFLLPGELTLRGVIVLKPIRFSFLIYLGRGKGTGRGKLLYQYYSRANLYARVPRLFRHYFLRSYAQDP